MKFQEITNSEFVSSPKRSETKHTLLQHIATFATQRNKS
jgi:hypothetical protein